MTDYFFGSYTAGSSWAEVDLVSDTDNPFPNITITNDDLSDVLNIKLNSNLNDTIAIKGGETWTIFVPVVKFFYQSSGTPAFRAMCDGAVS